MAEDQVETGVEPEAVTAEAAPAAAEADPGSVGAETSPETPEPVADEPVEAVAQEPEAKAEEELEDIDHEADPGSVGAAPPRPHDMIVAQLRIRFDELIDFIRPLEGELEGDLGELLTFIRSKIG